MGIRTGIYTAGDGKSGGPESRLAGRSGDLYPPEMPVAEHGVKTLYLNDRHSLTDLLLFTGNAKR
jgi:hypothetical protein